jgi:hypothetical protein
MLFAGGSLAEVAWRTEAYAFPTYEAVRHPQASFVILRRPRLKTASFHFPSPSAPVRPAGEWPRGERTGRIANARLGQVRLWLWSRASGYVLDEYRHGGLRD